MHQSTHHRWNHHEQRENELLRADVGDASIATADQTADFSVAAVEAAHTAAAETEQLQR